LTAAVLIVLGFLFGGGGSSAGAANLVVQLGALVALAFYPRAFLEFFREAPSVLTTLTAVTILLPLFQCVPLPPEIWHSLPGRALEVESLRVVGQQDDWMPFSLNVRRTFIAFLALLPPLAILILTWRANEADRRALLIVLVICGIAGVVLGTQQLAFGNREFMFYAEAVGSQDLHGTFANRNSAGLFVDIVLCVLIGLIWPKHLRSVSLARLALGVFIGVLLGLGLFLTRSRSSMSLVIIPAFMILIFLWRSRRVWLRKRSRTIALFAILGIVGLLGGLLASNAQIQRSLVRFDSLQDARPSIWGDTRSSIARFWPLGSGIGTFDEVFQLDESLEHLGPGRAARAHNEYLEVTLESGILGPVLIGGWVVILALATWRGVREATDGGLRLAASAVFVLLALQSILDYPLRSQALLCVAGLMLGILIAQTPVDANVKAGKR
jgi:O-antigen ligase